MPRPQPLMLSLGFRPFFLLAGIHGALAIALWAAYMGVHLADGMVTSTSVAVPPHVWHAHEMVFGFLTAAVAGFLLTAVPNWTGTAPVTGGRLALLVAVWITARLANWLSAWLPPVLVMIPDIAFLPLLGLFVGLPILRAGKTRNFPVAAVLAVYAVANVLSHLGMMGVLDDGGRLGRLLAVDLIVMLMVVIGGRITPAFSRNWLRMRGRRADDVVPPEWLDRAALAAVAAVMLSEILRLPVAVGAASAVAAVLVLVRLCWWRGWRVHDEPLLWMLHLGTVWLVAGLGLRAVSLLSGAVPEAAALHGLTSGAAGTLILAVMGRATLGHTGRPLTAPATLTTGVVLVSVATIARAIVGWLAPALYLEAMVVAGVAWTVAYGLFVLSYAPMLTQPRADQAG